MGKPWLILQVGRAYSLSFVTGLGLALLFHSGAWGQEKQGEKLVLNLKQAIERAIAKSPEIGIAQSETEASQADLMQVRAAYYPQLMSTLLLGPAQDAKEPVIVNNKITDPSPSLGFSSLGVFSRLDIRVIQPLYTFGKLSNRKEAAASGVKAKELEKEKSRNEIALRVTQLYYAIVLARGGLKSAQEADGFFDEARRRISRLLDLKSSTAAESDLYMVEAFRSDTRRGLAEAEKGVNVARSALRSLIQIPPEQDFDVAEEEIKLDERQLQNLETYTRMALSDRVEFRQLKEALRAKEFEVQALQSDRYPSIFAALESSLAIAPGREILDNNYIPDEFNHGFVGVVAGARWEFDFGILKGRVSRALAEQRALRYTKANAEMNIPIQVAKAFEETREWKKSAPLYREAALASRKWIISAMADFDMGVGTAENMLRAIEKYSHNQGKYIEALFNYNVSLAELKYAIGSDVFVPDR